MNEMKRIEVRRKRRKCRSRKHIYGTPECPRLTVYRSLKHIYAQLIDDSGGRTLAQASSKDKELRDSIAIGGNKTAATEVGKLIGRRAVEQGIKAAKFDRNGYRYHGRVRAVADAARDSGLKI